MLIVEILAILLFMYPYTVASTNIISTPPVEVGIDRLRDTCSNTLVLDPCTPVCEVVVSLDTVITPVNVVFRKSVEHWTPFEGFSYDLPGRMWSDSNKILFTNILFRESTGSNGIEEQIDQYLVAITALRRLDGKNYNELVVTKAYNKSKYPRYSKRCTRSDDKYYYIEKFVGAFSMESYNKPTFGKKINRIAWDKCYIVVNNTLEGDIPSYVPYIPMGTYTYLNSRLDTDESWIRTVTTKYVVVASTIKDHHFYADPSQMNDDEIKQLKRNPNSPLNKRFSSGKFAWSQ